MVVECTGRSQFVMNQSALHRVPSSRLPLWIQFHKVLAVIWGIGAWVEWFLTPMLVPNDGGPLPYIMFAPLVLAFAVGCLWLTVSFLVFMPHLSALQRISYSLLPCSNLLFHVARTVL